MKKKQNKKKIITITSIMLLVIIFFGIETATVNTIEMRTENQVKHLAIAVQMYISKHKEFPVFSQDTKTDTKLDESNYKELFFNLENSLNDLFIDQTKDSRGYDFKGVFDTNFDNKLKLGKKTYNSNIIIYSVGKNGIDDYGRKDDIIKK